MKKCLYSAHQIQILLSSSTFNQLSKKLNSISLKITVFEILKMKVCRINVNNPVFRESRKNPDKKQKKKK
jgi:hypothetical protein